MRIAQIIRDRWTGRTVRVGGDARKTPRLSRDEMAPLLAHELEGLGPIAA